MQGRVRLDLATKQQPFVLFRVLQPALTSYHPYFLKIYFNWRLITLQYCSGFCHTLT